MSRYVVAALVAVGVLSAGHVAYGRVVISEVAWPRRWRGTMGLLLGAFFLVMPGITHAGVLISEVAWMGTADNANAEWIELYNDGPAQDLTGWSLAATDGQPAIALSGTISANGYALLERTSDATVPSVTAFLIYTGAMGNTGEVLELRNDSGVLVDRVDGSGDWAIGGDNDTKATLQRSGNPPVGSFITAPATPQGGGGIAQEEDDTDPDTDGEVAGANTTRSSGSGGNILYGTTRTTESTTVRLDPALVFEVPSERTVTAGVPTEYMVRAFKETGKETVDVDVRWNFGDGSLSSGREVTHTYTYPGTYVVTIEGNRSGFMSEVTVHARMTVRVVEPDVEIVDVTGAYVEVKNISAEELELSGYVLMANGRTFRIPDGTFLAPKMNVRFVHAVTGLGYSATMSLFHPSGARADVFGVAPSAPAPRYSYQAPSVTPVADEPTDEESPEDVVVEVVQDALGATVAETAYASEREGNPDESSIAWWLAALASVIGITVAVIILARREDTETIAGFEIEDIEDDK